MDATEKKVLIASACSIGGLSLCLFSISIHFRVSPFDALGYMAMWVAPVPALVLAIAIFVNQLVTTDSQLREAVTISLLVMEFFVGALAAQMTDF